ncbi:MAG: DUF1629 domain-containing protein [Pseudomonadota bacterium]
MSEHFMLECYSGYKDMAMLEGVYFKGVGSWCAGLRFTKQPPIPVPIKIMPGYPNDLMEMYDTDALIITKRLLAALEEAGVDNLDVYPCEIVNEQSGFKTTDYVACNLVGLVKAVDIENSNVTGGSDDHLLDTDFDGLQIDPHKAKDYLMFRLAESTNAIMIHRTVKAHLEKRGFNMLTFVEPKDWIG